MFKRSDVKDIYTLSPMQQGMLFHSLLDKESTAYFEQAVFTINGALDIGLFEECFNKIIEKYDVLRTVFIYDKVKQPLQVVLKTRQGRISFEDISKLDEQHKSEYISEFIEKDKNKGFNLDKDIPMRIALIKINEKCCKAIWSFHHIIMDGWCLGLLLNDFFNTYQSLSNGAQLKQETLYPYSSFIKWLEKQDVEEAKKYWKHYIAGFEQPTGIPVIKSASDIDIRSYEESNFIIDAEQTASLQALAIKCGVTLNSLFQAVWAILLKKYNSSDDIIFGAVVSGRPSELPGIDNMIGLFINTIPVRVRMSDIETFSELVRQVQRDSIDSKRYEYYPLADIQIHTEQKHKLFDHIIAFENFPLEKGLNSSGDGPAAAFTVSDFKMFEQTNYDLTVIVEPGEELKLKLKYNSLCYSDMFIKRLEGHIRTVLLQVVHNPEMMLSDIELLTKEEVQEILYSFNDTAKVYPKDKTIHQLFEEQAEETPDNIAAVYEGRSITYKELNSKANQLARVLRDKGIGPDRIVALMVERSLDMIVSIIGILKAGGAYLPIDPEYPKDRIEYMLLDSEVGVLLTQKDFADKVSFEGEIIAVNESRIYTGECMNLESVSKSDDLACIIYTSGSTGKPKGNLTMHYNITRVVRNTNYIDINAEDNILQLSNYAFDGSTFDIYGALLNGARLVIASKENVIDVIKLANTIRKEKISVFFITTALFNTLVDINIECLEGVRKVLFGGERVSYQHAKKALGHLGENRIIHVYGPTESTVYATYYTINEIDEKLGTIPIGSPISNTKIYIVDKNNKLQPVGIAGELCIAGDGLAKGYLNRLELTAEKFTDNPFEPDTKMYRTGDLARWLPDGNIEFLGRIDHQIKLRGFRIELGEIESQLLNCEAVREAVVIAREDERGGKYLCAYFSGDREMEAAELRRYLSEALPDYMIPAYLVQLDKLPLTSNGKVDRKALPEPDGSMMTGTEYEAPRTELEAKLAELWQEVLGVERVGINDNFFELGGHSLKATNLTARIHKELDVEIPLKEIFKSPTVKDMSGYIKGQEKSIYDSIEPVEKSECYPLSSAQLRMYTLQYFEENNTGYNIPFVMKIEGKLDRERLEQVLRELIDRHEAFRTSFELIDGKPVQIVHDKVGLNIGYKECREDETKEVVQAFIKPFDLKKAPLLRAELLKLSDMQHNAMQHNAEDSYILMLDVHHIISDGTSMGILVNEFTQLYEGKSLPELRLQYKDYAVWQKDILHKEAMKQQEEYWLKEFSGEIPVLNMPTDFSRPTVQSLEGRQISTKLDKALADSLKSIAKETGTTLYMLLMAAYNVLLSKYSGQEDIVVGSPIAGRPHADLANIIGMFVNTLAMRNRPAGHKTFREFLEEVKANALRAYENQDYQFEELVEELHIPRDMSRNPLFDVMFIMQNMDMGEMAIEGLSFKPHDYESSISKFDITLTSAEVEDSIGLVVEYCTRLFKRESMERLLGHYINILGSIVKGIDTRLCDIEMLTEEEKQQLVYSFNDAKEPYPKDKTIHQLFEERAERTPDNIALAYESSKLTYRELNEKANQLAKMLQKKGVTSESIVGLLLDRSFEMIIAIMAVLKAGGAYLPIDSGYPQDRIEFLLEDSNAALLLTQNKYVDKIKFSNVINIEDNSIYTGENTNLLHSSDLSRLAYMIYTSGSTGKPKGVMVEHRSLMNTLYALQDMYPLRENDAFLFKTTYTFDVSVAEIFGWIMGAGSLVIMKPGAEKEPAAILKIIKEKNITHINFVPSMFNAFISLIDEKEWSRMNSLRYVMIAGEAISAELAGKINAISSGIRFENLYGPTEATIYATGYSLQNYTNSVNVPIGKPFANTRAYVLDKNNKLQPVGVLGELCLAGEGIARGYLNREELTKERFVEDIAYPDERMYRTGDLVRWLADGNIEYLGRIDHQVKIRGFRIELGEIESRLLNIDFVKDAVVTAHEDINGSKSLCAYVVVMGLNIEDKSVVVSEIAQQLRKVLPEYMLPSFTILMDKLPLNSNGKIDRKALPKPEENMTSMTEYAAPRTELETKLAALWQEVLGVDRIGINDNFFELGGHSLKGVNLIARIHRELEAEIPLREIFKSPTIKGMADYIKSQEKSIYDSIEPVEKSECYPLSSAQLRMYTLQYFEENNTSYNIPYVMKIEGKLDRERLEQVLRELIDRHEAFRTSFELIDGKPVQIVHDKVGLNIGYKECREDEAKEVVQAFIKPFNLKKAPLLRAELLKLSDMQHNTEDSYILMLDVHHIISDGTSMGILVNEFTQLYEGKSLPELRLQYKDYAVWQKDILHKEAMKQQEEYWLKEFSGEIPVLNMPTDFSRPTVQSLEGRQISTKLDKALADSLKSIARETGTTLYMLLMAAYNVLLSKYSGQEDIVVGSPIAGRPHADLANIIGMFVNTLAMRNRPAGQKTFREFLEEVKTNALRVYENQDYQFEELVEKLSIQRDLSRNPLFDVMLVMQNMDMGEMAIEGLSFKPHDYESSISKFDITLTAAEMDDTIGFVVEYCTRLFKSESMERLLEHYINILGSIVKSIDTRLCDIEMLTEEEKQQLVYSFNDTKRTYPRDKSIHQLFEEQAEETPDNIAAVYKGKAVTYRELNSKANQLARVLREMGIGAESNVVAIMVERSLEMVIGMLGILKAGGAYLPIDPDYPRDRMDYMLKDSKASVLLLQSHLRENIDFDGDSILLDNEELYRRDAFNLSEKGEAKDLAYIMYTSGSTGRPKGVMVEHRNVVRLVCNTNYIRFEETDRILQTGAIVFDACTFEIWGALLNGLTLYLADKEVILDAYKLEKEIKQNKITILWLTSSLFSQLAQQNMEIFSGLRYLLAGGDVLSPKHINEVRSRYKDLQVINGYGPTENTTFSTCFLIDREYHENIPIGSPIVNSTAYIVDKNNKLQPVGAAGELCVGGDGLARGYLNLPELTAEKFVANPFIPGESMYKTGDLARWLPDGNIEFLGRIDQQVKIRGFRIELGEIESQLLNCEAVREAVVIAREDERGGKYLCAYFAGDREMEAAELRRYLSEALPDYMIPAYFVQLDKLPLTSNGKVDRKALPEPDGSMMTGTEYEAPRTELEVKLAELWQEVLGVERIGINDNFFELGGHSLKATNLTARVHKELDAEVPLRELFKAPNIKAIGKYIEGADKNKYYKIQPVETREYYPLSSAQKRIYTLHSFKKDNISYNIPSVFKIEGKLDKQRFENVFNMLIDRHDAFRTTFMRSGEEIVQQVHKNIDFKIEHIEAEGLSLEEICTRFVRPFDLSMAPLVRAGLVKLKEHQHILLIDMHHIISDGYSVGILMKEFAELYEGNKLPELEIQYKDYAVWQNETYSEKIIKSREEYWVEALKNPPLLNIPIDFERPEIQSFEGAIANYEISAELTDKLREICKETGVTLYMLLLAACNVLMSKYSGQEDIVIGSPVAGRQNADLHKIMGMFVNTIALRNYPDGSKTFIEFLREVKVNSIKAFEYQDYQFEELVEKLGITRKMNRNPLFDVMFTVQSLDEESIKMTDLEFQSYQLESKIAKFDLTFAAAELKDSILISLEYCTMLYRKETIEGMLKHYEFILSAIGNSIDTKLSDIELQYALGCTEAMQYDELDFTF